jgi:hypothetical protein
MALEDLSEAPAAIGRVSRLYHALGGCCERNSTHRFSRGAEKVIGKHFPAMSLVRVGALVEDEARVEIEATAVIPS